MGGSFAMAVKEKFPGIRISGFARNQRSYERLRKFKFLDRVTKDLEGIVSKNRLLVMGLPVYVIIDYFAKISPFTNKDSVIMDMGSTKAEIHRAASGLLRPRGGFVGCHPLCGSEKKGAEHSRADLYSDADCIITSSQRNGNALLIKELWENLGAKTYFMTPGKHDKVLSSISHLPHVVSFCLSLATPVGYTDFNTKSFSDMSRISSSDAAVWRDIFLSNRENIGGDIDKLTGILTEFRELIKDGQSGGLLSLIKRANLKAGKHRGES